MKLLEEISRLLPIVGQYPTWVQAVFALTFLLTLTSVFLGVVFYPGLRTSQTPSSASSNASPHSVEQQVLTTEVVEKIVLKGEWQERNALVERYKKPNSPEQVPI